MKDAAGIARGKALRMESRLWRHRYWIAGTVAVLGSLMAFASIEERETVRREAPAPPADRALLLDVLGEVKRAWKPQDRDAALAKARAALPKYEPALRWLFSQPAHPLLGDGIRLAGELRVESALDDVQRLALVREHRRDALVAGDAIAPISHPSLLDLLESPDVDVLHAAVQIARKREPPPIGALLPLLRHPSTELRAAVLAVLPQELGVDVVPQLIDLAEDAQTDVALLGFQGLARTPLDAFTEQFLIGQLARPEVDAAALAALSRPGHRLDHQSSAKLWQVAEQAESQSTVARAFLCLETSGTYEVREVSRRVLSFDPLRKYFCARLLIAAGEQDGVWLLLDVLRDHGEDGDAAVAFACRTLLGSLSQKHASTTEAEWRAHFAENPITKPRTLPPPSLSL